MSGGEQMPHCNREKEIDNLLIQCDLIKEKEVGLQMSIQNLDNKLDNHIGNMNEKLSMLDGKIDTLSTISRSFDERLTSLEKTMFAIKWFLVGAGLILLATTGSSWLPLLIKIFTKGV